MILRILCIWLGFLFIVVIADARNHEPETLRRVWDEFSYRVDVVRAAGGGHIQHL
jgi:hypothetical protein